MILDRYYYSTMAYQGALGLDVEKIRKENESFAPRPDLVIILDAKPELGLDRIKNRRGEALNYFETLEYQRRVREIFLGMSGFDNVKIVKASGSLNEVQDEIRRLAEELLASIG